MSMGKVVVLTPIGAEGLPVRRGENIVLADDPGAFAHRVTSLLRDATRRREIGLAARKLVAEKYSWAKIAEDFAEILAGSPPKRPARPPPSLAADVVRQ